MSHKAGNIEMDHVFYSKGWWADKAKVRLPMEI